MPLISADELANAIKGPDIVVVDCRWYLGKPVDGRVAYEEGHLPGAVYADLEADLSGEGGEGRHPLPEPAAFDVALGAMGISGRSMVIAYDDRGGGVAARLWWMLTAQGHDRTYILDGGIQAWVGAGGSLEQGADGDRVESAPAGIATSPWTGTIDGDAVADRGIEVVVGDARSGERYRGETEPVDGKAGHIPGAVSLPMTGNLDNLRFKPAAELREVFSAAGIDRDAEVVMQCGSGVTACHNILAMEVAGLPRPSLYVGSWSDWSSTDRPIATGSEPG